MISTSHARAINPRSFRAAHVGIVGIHDSSLLWGFWEHAGHGKSNIYFPLARHNNLIIR
jgi:hypothetical protein